MCLSASSAAACAGAGASADDYGDDYDHTDHDSDECAASSTPPMRWAARCVVHLYSADSPVALSRSDDNAMLMFVYIMCSAFGISFLFVDTCKCSVRGQGLPFF